MSTMSMSRPRDLMRKVMPRTERRSKRRLNCPLSLPINRYPYHFLNTILFHVLSLSCYAQVRKSFACALCGFIYLVMHKLRFPALLVHQVYMRYSSGTQSVLLHHFTWSDGITQPMFYQCHWAFASDLRLAFVDAFATRYCQFSWRIDRNQGYQGLIKEKN